VASLASKTKNVSLLQLWFLSATWLAGIYVNGFVSILPGTPTEALLLNPAVESHIILASLSAATSAFIVGLAWASGSRRLVGVTLLASLSIVVAGDSGLAFVLGGGSDSAQSMIMASAFVTALFLTFLSMSSLGKGNGSSARGAWGRPRVTNRAARVACYLALVLFYAVFVTGIYVNLFVAGPVFSLPLNSEPAAFARAENSALFIVHEVLGAALLGTLVLLAVSLWVGGARRLSMAAAAPTILVSYSAYVGSQNLTSPLALGVSVLVPMLSSTGLMAAIIITMLLALEVRAGGRRTDLRDGPLIPPGGPAQS
jgi:hypothetical protein